MLLIILTYFVVEEILLLYYIKNFFKLPNPFFLRNIIKFVSHYPHLYTFSTLITQNDE